MLPGFKPTAELKICGLLPQSSVRGLALDPDLLLVPSNQTSSLKPFCPTGRRSCVRLRRPFKGTVVYRDLFEEPTQPSVTD